jgi:hypothetical protein
VLHEIVLIATYGGDWCKGGGQMPEKSENQTSALLGALMKFMAAMADGRAGPAAIASGAIAAAGAFLRLVPSEDYPAILARYFCTLLVISSTMKIIHLTWIPAPEPDGRLSQTEEKRRVRSKKNAT